MDNHRKIESNNMVDPVICVNQAAVSSAANQDRIDNNNTSRLPAKVVRRQIARKTILSLRDHQARLMRQNQLAATMTKADEESDYETNTVAKVISRNDVESEEDTSPLNGCEQVLATNKLPTIPQRKRKYRCGRMSATKAAPKRMLSDKCKQSN